MTLSFSPRRLTQACAGANLSEEALAGYERRRNEVAMPLYEMTLSAAEYEAHSPRAFELRAALRGSQADTNDYIGVVTGSLPKEAFFNSENIQRIIAEAERRNAAT